MSVGQDSIVTQVFICLSRLIEKEAILWDVLSVVCVYLELFITQLLIFPSLLIILFFRYDGQHWHIGTSMDDPPLKPFPAIHNKLLAALSST